MLVQERWVHKKGRNEIQRKEWTKAKTFILWRINHEAFCEVTRAHDGIIWAPRIRQTHPVAFPHTVHILSPRKMQFKATSFSWQMSRVSATSETVDFHCNMGFNHSIMKSPLTSSRNGGRYFYTLAENPGFSQWFRCHVYNSLALRSSILAMPVPHRQTVLLPL